MDHVSLTHFLDIKDGSLWMNSKPLFPMESIAPGVHVILGPRKFKNQSLESSIVVHWTFEKFYSIFQIISSSFVFSIFTQLG